MPHDTTPDWSAHFEQACDYAETVLLESSALFQMCVAYARDGTIVPVVGTATMPEQAFHDMVRLVCEAHDAIGLSCMSEAWISQVSSAQLTDYVSGAAPPLAERAEKVEAVSVSLAYRLASGERQLMASVRTIERDADGKVVRLGRERSSCMKAGASLALPSLALLPAPSSARQPSTRWRRWQTPASSRCRGSMKRRKTP